MDYLLLVPIILWIMALLMRAGKLHILILRYEWFHKMIRNRSFTIDEDGLTKAYFFVFIFSGVLVLVYWFLSINEFLGSWSTLVFFAIIIGQILYLNITSRFLIIDE